MLPIHDVVLLLTVDRTSLHFCLFKYLSSNYDTADKNPILDKRKLPLAPFTNMV